MKNNVIIGLLLGIIGLPSVEAFDWGDFHKVAVIFFSFFGPLVILGAIAAVAYLACIKSWYESFREEIRETHRSFHPWPPGSAKWQLQQFIRSSRQSDPTGATTSHSHQPASSIKSAPPMITSVSHKLQPPPLSPGYLQSPIPSSNPYTCTTFPPQHFSYQQPLPSIIIPDPHRYPSPHPPPERSPTRIPEDISFAYKHLQPYDQRTTLTPSFSMVEHGQVEEIERHRDVISPISPEPLEAITVRTTTTTRRTTVLSPIQGRKNHTIV